jgi:hypothetical protein
MLEKEDFRCLETLSIILKLIVINERNLTVMPFSLVIIGQAQACRQYTYIISILEKPLWIEKSWPLIDGI